MEDDENAPNSSMQLIQTAGAESHASTTVFQDWNIVVLERFSAHIPTGSAVCMYRIWRNILVFHFASHCIYHFLFYGVNRRIMMYNYM